MERKISFAIGEYYHLYNRGVNKSKTFFDKHDYWRFIFLLYLCNSDRPVHLDNQLKYTLGSSLPKIKHTIFSIERGERLVDIGAYCLMPNHFHILVRERIEGGIPQLMLKLGTAYTSYVNKRHDRTGPVFNGPYKATHIGSDTYLKYLYAYIHLNPVKIIESSWKETRIRDRKKAENFLKKYQFSSYADYAIGETESMHILNKTKFPHYFEKSAEFDTYIADWLNYHDPLPT